ncbi:MAG: Gfo/Idh/MocA family oxidoreductase [Capsulimonadales bacterium]|nr:Gfo/Idh/MocA family oxidoreductase [Capsulimonadales bacterium]
MSEKVRIAFVGVGNMGQAAHLRNYRTLPDCEVTAIAELRTELAEKVARKWGIPRVYPNAEALLEKEKPDGIVASQPFEKHGGIVAPLYRAGVPVLTEKPLASAIEVGERMLAELRRGGSWHMVGYHKRSDPATMAAKEQIERWKADGTVGKMRFVRLTMPEGDWIAGGFNENVRSDEPYPSLPNDTEQPNHSKYVSFVNYFIHQVNLLRHLFGEPYRVTFADRSGALLVAESESGVTGVIEMTPYRTTIDWQESALVTFERGYVKVDLPAPLAHNRPGRLEIFSDPGNGVAPQTVIPQLPWVHAMRQQAMNFVAAIRGERPPMCTAEEALEDLKVSRDYLDLRYGGNE